MIKTLEKIFDFKKTIKNNISILIDAFSAFYGKDNLETIKNKIKHTPISLKIEDNSIEEIILESKIEELLNYIDTDIKDESLKRELTKEFISKSFEVGKLYIKEFEMYKFSDDLEEIYIYREYQKVKDKFTLIKYSYKEINELLKIYNYAKDELKLKYRIEYQNKVKDILLNHTKIPVNAIINNLDLFVEKDFNDIPLVHLVHEKDNSKIVNIFENDMLFPKEMVIQGINNLKKEYFDKLTGLDLMLEEYYNNPDTKYCILDDKILSNLEKIREKIINGYNKSAIDIFDFITTKKGITDEFYKQYNYSKTSQSNWRPYKKDAENLLEKFIILYFDDIKSLKNLDATLVHESNHIFELKPIDDNKFTVGWETFIYDFETNQMSEINNGKYSYINEGINELISLDILKEMHDKEYFIFNAIENSLDKNSMYNKYEFLLKEFYEEYKDTIIESRLKGDINIIINKVGKESFNDLNNLVNDFNKYFSTSKPLKSFEDKKNAILEKMKEYGNRKQKN